MHTPPSNEHAWLRQLTGSWTFDTEAVMAPNEPPMQFSGTENVRMLGELWAICEGQIPGDEVAHSIMTLGFDPDRDIYVGTFVASMMTHLWTYEGRVDEGGRILTLETQGPSFSQDGGMVPYRDVIEVIDADHRTLSSFAVGADGKWKRFMHARYRRSSY